MCPFKFVSPPITTVQISIFMQFLKVPSLTCNEQWGQYLIWLRSNVDHCSSWRVLLNFEACQNCLWSPYKAQPGRGPVGCRKILWVIRIKSSIGRGNQLLLLVNGSSLIHCHGVTNKDGFAVILRSGWVFAALLPFAAPRHSPRSSSSSQGSATTGAVWRSVASWG